jgi:FkbM family methyltransferase
MRLENYGVKAEFAKGSSGKDVILLKGEPWLRETLDLEGVQPIEVINLLALLVFAIKYGASIHVNHDGLSWKDSGFSLSPSNNLLILNTNEKSITVNDGVRFYLDALEPAILAETFYLKIHEFGNLQSMKILDVGAAFGDTPLYFSKRGAERVYAVEPVNYDAMLRNLELNPELSKRIYPIRRAMGKNEMLRFKYTPGTVDGGASAFGDRLTRTGETVDVASRTLSSILDELNVDKVDIAKIDCKGCELTLTKDDLSRVKKYVKIEYTLANARELKSLIQTVKDAGLEYSIYLHNPDYLGPVSLHGTLLARRQ